MHELTGSTLSKNLQVIPSQVVDSRGKPTVAVELRLGQYTTTGDVPAGASKGEDEAQTVDVQTALANITHVLTPLLHQQAVDLLQHTSLISLEEAMIARAGDNFKDLGANAVLPVSRALWRLAAQLHHLPLYAYIRQAEPTLASQQRVSFYMNIFNGGLHALQPQQGEILGRDRINIQEIMVVPWGCSHYREAMHRGEQIDAALKNLLLQQYGKSKISRADEAGFSVSGLGDSSQAIAHVVQAISQCGLQPGRDVKLALDVAASSFYDHHRHTYAFAGKKFTTQDMIDYLLQLADTYPDLLLSIEDGLAENDWAGWQTLTAQLAKRQVITVGDDLFVTQTQRLQRGIQERSAQAILIKVNQNGTMHGTFQVMKMAQQAGMRCIISHRSGETLDDSIADIAYATGAFGLKTGDPQPLADFPDPTTWVRRRKYLRMIEIEEGT